jgi:hypothetical protein
MAVLAVLAFGLLTPQPLRFFPRRFYLNQVGDLAPTSRRWQIGPHESGR